MKRMFLAIPIDVDDNGFKPLLERFQRYLSHEKMINWINPEHVHLTLKFIGNVTAEQVPQIIEKVKSVVARHHRFALDFNRVGLFGSRYDPRVLWLGMNEIPDDLLALENDVLDAFDELGFLRDRQNFVPHLTLGRIKTLCERDYFQKVVQGTTSQSYVCQDVKELILFQSFLYPDGARYKRVASFQLTDFVE